MIHAQSCKFVAMTPPAAISDNATLTVAEVDTSGFDYMQIFVILGATDIATVTLKVTESDSAGSGHADVTGLIWGTSANIAGATSTLPSATDDDKCFLFEIDLRARKRYIDMSVVTGNGTLGTYIAIHGLLWRAKDLPVTATERGFAEILRV